MAKSPRGFEADAPVLPTVPSTDDPAAFKRWMGDAKRALEIRKPIFPPTFRLYLTGSKLVGANTALTWDAVEYDNGGFWDSGTADQVVVPAGADGIYALHGDFDGNIAYIELDSTKVSVEDSHTHWLGFLKAAQVIKIKRVASGTYGASTWFSGIRLGSLPEDA